MSLKAHHILQHAFGGRTRSVNGLLLCNTCHGLFHSGVIPTRFAYSIKQSLSEGSIGFKEIVYVSDEDLLQEIDMILTQNAPVNSKFTELNDVLIYANLLPRGVKQFYVLVQVLLAKASILNDQTPTVRGSLKNTRVAMDNRRLWSRILCAAAKRYAEEIHDHLAVLSALHKRAVSQNARNRFPSAVKEFQYAIKYLEQMPIKGVDADSLELHRARLLRERASCMSKDKPRSIKASQLSLESLEIAESIGDLHNVNDALVRCCEVAIFTGKTIKAESFLSKLYDRWPSMDTHLRAITIKMHARLAMALGKIEEAESLIGRGTLIAEHHGYYHQAYHFARLKWNLEGEVPEGRERFIT